MELSDEMQFYIYLIKSRIKYYYKSIITGFLGYWVLWTYHIFPVEEGIFLLIFRLISLYMCFSLPKLLEMLWKTTAKTVESFRDKLFPVKLTAEEERAHNKIFRPFGVNHRAFKKILTSQFPCSKYLNAGEAYAIQNETRVDNLALLLSGRVQILLDDTFAYEIGPCHFISSPEWRVGDIGKIYKVSIVAATDCHYLYSKDSGLASVTPKNNRMANLVRLALYADKCSQLAKMQVQMRDDDVRFYDIFTKRYAFPIHYIHRMIRFYQQNEGRPKKG